MGRGKFYLAGTLSSATFSFETMPLLGHRVVRKFWRDSLDLAGDGLIAPVSPQLPLPPTLPTLMSAVFVTVAAYNELASTWELQVQR